MKPRGKWRSPAMSQAIRAIYTQGRLRLLEPVSLTEGQEIEVMILSAQDRVRVALGDLLVEREKLPDEALDEEALAREVEAGFQNQPPLSASIIEERRAGP
jgi:predicted DNA-binding antitoxin AbrB/MazE fold protein